MSGRHSKPSAWHDPGNAERYHAFAVVHPFYREINQRLIELVELREPAIVLDLACGTGMTAEAILRASGPGVRVVGVDASLAQVELARAHVTDPRARFVHAAAESMADALHGPFDFVVCNAGFWFMKPRETLGTICDLLAGGGRLAFNLTTRFVPVWEARLFGGPRPLGRGDYLHQRILRIARRELGYTPPEMPAAAETYEERLESALAEVPLRLLRAEPQLIRRTKAEMFAWYRTPVFRESVLPGVEADVAESIISRAYEDSDPAAADEESRWIHFIFERG